MTPVSAFAVRWVRRAWLLLGATRPGEARALCRESQKWAPNRESRRRRLTVLALKCQQQQLQIWMMTDGWRFDEV